MIEAIHQRTTRLDINPDMLSDEALAELFEISKMKDFSFPIRIAIGLFATDEIKRRSADDPELVERSFFTIDLMGMDKLKLSAALYDAFLLMFSNRAALPDTQDVLAKLSHEITACSRMRIEEGF